MLRQRVVTALVMLAVLLPALFHPVAVPFAVLTLALMAAAGWEWARLNGVGTRQALLLGVALGVAMAVLWWGVPLGAWLPRIWLLASLAWFCLGGVLLAGGVARWATWPRAWRLAGGMLLLAVAWMAMVEARQIGLVYLLSVMTLVWMADLAAYFGGRAFGRRKLAPSISPGKSWEGALSGFAGVCALALFWLWFDTLWPDDSLSVFGVLLGYGVPWLAAGLVLLTAMSVVGDLVESLVKRSAGVKDSSGLLPGHGGVLDRIDALLPVLPVALMLSELP
jgi:phosphatidate cytidylyltransferase